MPEKKTTNSIHEEHRARMQERVARDGLTSLAAHEVLEYLLYFSIPRRDTNPLAHRLIQHFWRILPSDGCQRGRIDAGAGHWPRQRKTAAFLPGCCPLLPESKSTRNTLFSCATLRCAVSISARCSATPSGKSFI
mgnify:CR=1 FL=1